MENKTFPIWEAFKAKIKTKKKFFIVSTPLIFAVFVALDFCIAKYYDSTLVIMRESEQAVELNRAITLNKPEQYDLGLARTDNAVRMFGYEPIVESTEFLSGLLDVEVTSLDGSWKGTYEQYILNRAHHPFWERAYGAVLNLVSGIPGKKSADEDSTKVVNSDLLSYSEMMAISDMKKNITIKIDKLTDVITIKVRTQDPLISMQVARALEQHLSDFLRDYEHNKMQVTMDQLNAIAEQARSEYEAAKASKAKDADIKKQIMESFERQAVVYNAQMMFHPSFMEIAKPQICYKGAGPSRWKMPFVLTILFELLAMAWVGRSEVKKTLKQL